MHFPVQYVNRPNLDFRGYAGTLASGSVKSREALKFAVWRGISVARIVTLMAIKKHRAKPLLFNDGIDVAAASRGRAARRWLLRGAPRSTCYGWRNGSRWHGALATVTLNSRVKNPRVGAVAVSNWYKQSDPTERRGTLNGIGLSEMTFDEPLALDIYQQNPVTGGLIFLSTGFLTLPWALAWCGNWTNAGDAARGIQCV